MEFHLPGLPARRDTLEAEFLERVAQPMGMDVRLTDAARPKRVAIMVVKQATACSTCSGAAGVGSST